jgi:hypothetical protein
MPEQKLAVCGCSWSTRDPVYPGIEFGQLVADHYSLQYKNFALPGVSNFVIAMQIDQALRDYDPDIFIINATTATRVELPVLNGTRYNHTALLDNLNKSVHSNSIGSIFDEQIDLALVDNPFYNGAAEDSLNFSFNEHNHRVFRDYFLHFYDADVEKHKDFYTLQCVLYKLKSLNKTVIFSPNTFEWAEAYDTKPEITTDDCFDYDNSHRWDLSTQEFVDGGIAEYLHVDTALYGPQLTGSPGNNMSHHLSGAAHAGYAAQLIAHIDKFALI